MDESRRKSQDVVPPIVSRALGISWIALFAGRWIVVQLLLAYGVFSASIVADLDDRVLQRVYLVLLAFTIMVVALRAVRASRLGASDRS